MTNDSTQETVPATEELALRSTATEEIVLAPTEPQTATGEASVSDTLVSAAAITNSSTTAPDVATDATQARDRLKVQLREEQIDVQKIVRQMGEVTISKRVVEETVNVPVTIRREEITMTRNDISVPLNATEQIGASAQAISEGSAGAFQEQTIKILLHEEVPHVTKTTRVSGEVEISKRLLSEDKTITDSVRHEEADIHAPENIRISDPDKPL